MDNKEIAKKLYDQCGEYIANQIMEDRDLSEDDFNEVYLEILKLLKEEYDK